MKYKVNKKQRKQLKQIAGTYPPSIVPFQNTSPITGAELLKDEKYIEKFGNLIDGKPIDPDKKYGMSHVDFRPLNHQRRIVKFYKEWGPDQYLTRYNNWFQEHAKSMYEQFPHMFKKSSSEEEE